MLINRMAIMNSGLNRCASPFYAIQSGEVRLAEREKNELQNDAYA